MSASTFNLPQIVLQRVRDAAQAQVSQSDGDLNLVQQNGQAIERFTPERRTPQVCLAAVQQDGHAIQFLTDAQRTPQVCLAAVRRHAYAAKYLSEAQLTPEVCLAAVKRNGDAIDFLSKSQRTPEVCLAAVRQSGWAIERLGASQRTPEVIMAAVQQDADAIKIVAQAQRTAEVCLAAVRQNGWVIQSLSKEQRTPEVCLAAVQQDANVIGCLTREQRAAVEAELSRSEEKMEGVRDVFIAAHATGDGVSGPDYIHIAASEQFLQQLQRLQALCEKEGLTEVRVEGSPTWGADRDEADLSGVGELVVSVRSFYFCQNLRHCDEEFQSRGVGIDDFCAQVRAMAPMDTLLLCDVQDPCEELLEDLGYEFSEDSDQPGLWVWMAPSDNCECSFSTRSEAVSAAWQDAGAQTCSIRGFKESYWQDLSIPEQISAMKAALSEEPVRERE